MNVNVENLNMNVSLQHRTVIGLVEDRKWNSRAASGYISVSS